MAQTLDDPDLALVREARGAPSGDLRAFESLVETYRSRILANCRYIAGDSDAEDLAQEVFVKAYFALRGFEERSSFRHWLQRIKVNHCLNHRKKRDREDAQPITDELAETMEPLRVDPSVERELAAMEERQRVETILGLLPETLRLPLVMCDMDDLAYEDIASELGIGLSAVKMRIKRGREQFRKLYTAYSPTAREA